LKIVQLLSQVANARKKLFVLRRLELLARVRSVPIVDTGFHFPPDLQQLMVFWPQVSDKFFETTPEEFWSYLRSVHHLFDQIVQNNGDL
jgi:hypothetical protein